MDGRITSSQAAISILCKRHHVSRLALFGSAAKAERETEPADFDFLVEFEPLPEGGLADAFFGLLAGLEDLLQRPVDLVSDRAIENPYFRAEVDRTKVELYAG